MTMVRIWRTRVAPQRLADYETFAQERSLPMFRNQSGFRGVVFARRGDDHIVISFWQDPAAIEALARSPSYRQTVQEISATGFLVGESTTEALEITGGDPPRLQ
jgi:heme-degrading monooxygenase HmoA